ncbi:MAG: hypothetical protein GWO38_26475, partial [Phycisphaerae bacterium]|nr:hypothetical protein [Phycisphaerae bacterium]NIP55001.1 hypothetical protein [Phycisphaerae bacterium]NIW47275.1 hypothetical protein [Gammaproteobacteria bacterium]NIX31075.1 hypothetical protein [Phycisphaerae bacterium]
AEALHLINEEIMLDYFRGGQAEMILLTDWDWRIIENSTNTEAIVAALEEGYELLLEKTEWGQFQGKVEVYGRRDSSIP